MKPTSKYIFSLLFISVSFFAHTQETKVKDSIKPKTEKYGLRLGIDLFRLSRSFWEKDYRGLELTGDFKITRRHYIAAEIGNENKTVEERNFNFTTQGTYLKAGFDYNAYENWAGMQNQIYIGMRYGISSFSQKLNNYTVYNTNHYFGENAVVEGQKFDGLSAHWAEIVTGIKAELVNNLYIGFNVRLNYLIGNNKPENFDNLYIPGFNKTYNGKFGTGFSYTISYFIPLYKSTIKNKEVTRAKKN